MNETDRNNPFSIQAAVDRYLGGELNSGDPERVQRASLAKGANETYGIGGWYWENGPRMGGLIMESVRGKIIPLGPKIK